jgi:hypothetical protein
MYKVILDFTRFIREFKARRRMSKEKAAEFRRSRTLIVYRPYTADGVYETRTFVLLS